MGCIRGLRGWPRCVAPPIAAREATSAAGRVVVRVAASGAATTSQRYYARERQYCSESPQDHSPCLVFDCGEGYFAVGSRPLQCVDHGGEQVVCAQISLASPSCARAHVSGATSYLLKWKAAWETCGCRSQLLVDDPVECLHCEARRNRPDLGGVPRTGAPITRACDSLGFTLSCRRPSLYGALFRAQDGPTEIGCLAHARRKFL